MKLANRMSELEPSATVGISQMAAELEADGAEVVDMGGGTVQFDTPDHIRRRAKEAIDDGETLLTPPPGIRELRTEVAEKLEVENDLTVTPEDVYVTPGSKQAIFQAIVSLVDDGDEVVLIDPAWVSYEAMVKIAGGTLNRVKLDPETGFAFDADKLAEAVSDDTRLLVINTPNNPTGAVYSRSALEVVRDLAVEHDFWVVTDEIYEKITFDGSEHHSLGSVDGMEDRTVTVNGFSKGYAMTGWRLGYFTGPELFLTEVNKIQSNTVTAATTFAQHGGVAALSGPQKPVRDMCRRHKDRRDALLDVLTDSGISCPPPQAGLYAFVPIDETDDVDFCERLLQEAHVAATPGSAFGIEGFIRLSYTMSEESVKAGAERLVSFMER